MGLFNRNKPVEAGVDQAEVIDGLHSRRSKVNDAWANIVRAELMTPGLEQRFIATVDLIAFTLKDSSQSIRLSSEPQAFGTADRLLEDAHSKMHEVVQNEMAELSTAVDAVANDPALDEGIKATLEDRLHKLQSQLEEWELADLSRNMEDIRRLREDVQFPGELAV